MPASSAPAALIGDWTVAQTVHQLLQLLDDKRYEEMAAMFADDGIWARRGEDLVGPTGVLAAMRQRPVDLMTRHLATNMVVTAAGEAVEARYYVTVFAHHGEEAVGVLGAPHAIFLCEDRLVPVDGAWRFARRSPRPVFQQP